MSFDAAVALLMGPDGPFATERATINGQTYDVFRRTPVSLRALFDTARTRGDDVFLVYEDERWTFAEVMRHVDALAALLVERYGIASRRPRRDRHAQLPGVDRRLRGDHLDRRDRGLPQRLVDAPTSWPTASRIRAAPLLIADRERIERAVAARVRSSTRACCRCAAPGRCPRVSIAARSVLAPRRPMPAVEIDADDDATILYTSGTTGHPKGAVSTHRAVLSALLAFGCRAAVRNAMHPDERGKHPFPPSFILAVPLFHVTGLIPVMLSAFAAGIKLVMMYKWNPERALELIERERVTMFVGVPTMIVGSARVAGLRPPRHLEPAERRRRRRACSARAGAPRRQELPQRPSGHRLRDDRDQRLRAAELPATTTCASRRSAGRVLPILRGARHRRRTAAPLAPGEVGEIWFRGAEPDPRLLEQAGGDRRDDRRRLAAQRRHRPHRRRGLRLRRGPRQGHGPARRREHLLRRGRGRPLRAPRRVRGGGLRRAPPAPRRGGGGRRLPEAPEPASTSTSCAATSRAHLAAFKVPTYVEIVRASRCRATPRERSSSGRFATRWWRRGSREGQWPMNRDW